MPTNSDASKLAAILESAVDAIITIDSTAAIITANPAAEALFQYEKQQFVGKNINFLMPEPYHAEHDGYIKNYLTTGTRKIIGSGREVIGRRCDGSTFPMHLSVSEFEVDGERYFTGIIHDLTARKDAERGLQQAQKMESMGQLTGGIAHDFNNLLTVIVGNLEMLDDKLVEPLQKDLLREALEAAELGSRLTNRLLAFARRSYLAPELVNLNSFVLGLTDMLHRTIGADINLITSLRPELWSTRVDPSQVESAIVNLAVNARDAMPKGGKLVLETRNAYTDEDYAAQEVGLTPGDYVVLSVSDTGTGMSESIREKAFEPFFTTKEVGRGTGLGLSMIYGFARQSGGHASIYSEVGKGTTINIYLPRHEGTADKRAGLASSEPAFPGNGESILAVEDDDRVRRLTIARLTQLGYKVLEAANGAEALEVLQRGEQVDLMFTDLVMPGGMSGYELAEAVRAKYPHMRILLTSGYAEELANGEKLSAEQLKVLRKPYRQADLAESIHKALRGE